MKFLFPNFFRSNDRTITEKATYLFFISCILLYAVLANKLRGGPDFGDETEKLVGALMISKGGLLYRDVFSHHGPLSFMLAQIYLAVSGSTSIAHYRIIPLIFSLLSLAAIYFSPALMTRRSRLMGAALMSLGLAANQTIFGLMLGMYQIYAGHLIVCGLALLIMPVLLDCPLRKISAFLGGAALGFVFFAAYSFVIAIVCLFGVCAYKAAIHGGDKPNPALQWGLYALLGCLAAGATVLAWLALYGDIVGYFVYHFYFNQFVYIKFSFFEPFTIFILMVPVFNYFYVIHFLPTPWAWIDCVTFFCVLFYSVCLGLSSTLKNKFRFRALPTFCLLLLGIMYSDPRGCVGFQANTIVIVGMGLMALVGAIIIGDLGRNGNERLIKAVKIGTGLVFACFFAAQFFVTTYLYEANPLKYYKLKGDLRVSKAPAMEFIRSIVGPDEAIEALPLVPIFYIHADRMPVSGNYYYLPWQDAYFKSPLMGYKIDLCRDIEEKKPKVVYLDSQIKIWGYETSTYLGCVQDILKHKYFETTKMKDLWVRTDVALARKDVLETAIVPADFDVSNLDPALRERVNAAKAEFKNLESASESQCLLSALNIKGVNRGPLRIGSCSDPEALHVGLRQTSDGVKLMTLPSYDCIEVTDASTNPQATLREWPCMKEAANQNFTIISLSNGIKIRAVHSQLCLAIDGDAVVQSDCAKATVWRP